MSHSTPSAEKDSHYSYCLNKAAPDGSSLYYACLFESAGNRQTVIGLHAFLHELNDILLECSDPGVARIKYQWWLEELERLRNKQARHPVSSFIQQQLAPGDDAIALLKTAVMHFEQFLMLDQPGTFDDSLALFRNSAGNIWRYCAMALSINEESGLNTIADMAATYYLLQALQQPNTFMTESCCVLPGDAVNAKELNGHSGNDNALRAEFSQMIGLVIEQLDSTCRQLDKHHRSLFRHGLILNRIGSRTAREILRADSPLLDMRVGLTPIRKLAIAWWTNLRLR